MYRPDQEPSDGERVVHAACHLDVTEFDIFRRAYNDWFGHEAEPSVLEREFAHYTHFGTTPPWVRHYARMCLDQACGATGRPRRNPGLAETLARLLNSNRVAGSSLH